jgi:Protein of unknown function (DUF4238)
MGKSKNHHYVSQFIQRNLAGGNIQLFYYDKREPTLGIRKNWPRRIFAIPHLNSIERKDGTRDAALEGAYGLLETKAKPVVTRLIEAADKQVLPDLATSERKIWFNFFYHQLKRAPDSFERLGLVAEMPSTLPDFIAEYERSVRPLTDEQRAEMFSKDGLRLILQQASVIARGAGSPEVIDALSMRGIAVARIGSSEESFVLGDHPMARMGGDGGIATSEIWFPITHNVAVSPYGAAGTETLVVLADSQVRRINEIIWTQSNEIASRSEELLLTFVGQTT